MSSPLAAAAAAADGKKLSLGSAVDCTPASAERVAWVRSLLASDSPSHRVEGLEEADLLDRSEAGMGKGSAESPLMSARRDAALLLGYLERIGEPYGPPEVGLFCDNGWSPVGLFCDNGWSADTDENDMCTYRVVVRCRICGIPCCCGMYRAMIRYVSALGYEESGGSSLLCTRGGCGSCLVDAVGLKILPKMTHVRIVSIVLCWSVGASGPVLICFCFMKGPEMDIFCVAAAAVGLVY